MSNTPESLPIELASAILSIREAGVQATQMGKEAASLQKQGDSLLAEAHTLKDEPIRSASHILIERANDKEQPMSERAKLLGALLIYQNKPSGVIWSGKADIEGTLSKFDALEPGAPIVNTKRTSWDYWGGIVTKHPISVIPSIAQGMGGLPEAEIRFGMKPIAHVREKAQVRDEEIQLLRFDKLAGLTIGVTAVQALLDNHIATRNTRMSLRARDKRIANMTAYLKLGQLFNEELGDVLSLEGIEELVRYENELLLSTAKFISSRTFY